MEPVLLCDQYERLECVNCSLRVAQPKLEETENGLDIRLRGANAMRLRDPTGVREVFAAGNLAALYRFVPRKED